jgi:hypothetical protein
MQQGSAADSGQFLEGTRLIGATSPQAGALIEINDLCHLHRENRARPAVRPMRQYRLSIQIRAVLYRGVSVAQGSVLIASPAPTSNSASVDNVLAFGILIFPSFSLFSVFALMAVILLVRLWGLFGRPLL